MEIGELSKLLNKCWFINYVYNELEQEICEDWEPHRRDEFLTGRFCAKEAVYKALPNLRGLKIKPREIVISRDEYRKPKVDILNSLFYQEIEKINISITHKGNICASIAMAY